MTIFAILACVSLVWLIAKVGGAVTVTEPLNRWVTLAAAVIVGLWVFRAYI